METPKNKSDYRATRNPTPRLSERKKKLFEVNKVNGNILNEDDDLEGIRPLEIKGSRTPKSRRSMDALLKGKNGRNIGAVSFLSGESESENDKQSNPSPTRRSLRLTEKNLSPGDKENQSLENPDEKHLQHLFKTSMSLRATSKKISPKTPKKPVTIAETSEEEEDDEEVLRDSSTKQETKSQKRLLSSPKSYDDNNDEAAIKSPSRKIAKVVSPLESIKISTKAFYSGAKTLKPDLPKSFNRNVFPSTKVSPKSRRSLGSSSTINRGVKHKIKKPMANHYRPQSSKVDLDTILNNLTNEKLKKLITSKRQQREQIEKIHKIFRQAENPIEMARPLSVISNDDKNNNEDFSNKNSGKSRSSSDFDMDYDFSDIEYESDLESSRYITDKEEVIPLITHKVNSEVKEKSPETQLPNRKFFKSKRTNVMKMQITDNIRASVCNGKIQLLQEKKKRRPKPRLSFTNEFSDEQATVEEILKNLDDTAFGDLTIPSEQINNEPGSSSNTNDLEETPETLQEMEAFTNDFLSDIQLEDSRDYAEFRKRLPYQTEDPSVIEQQHLLLDFLISNNICTEENFEIFIANPDDHREKAAEILDNLVVVLNEEQLKFRDRIPFNTTDPKLIEQQQNFLYFLLENNICNEENFDIFIANYDKRQAEAEAIISEYQAKQCPISEIPENQEMEDDRISIASSSIEVPQAFRQMLSAAASQTPDSPIEKPSIPLENIHTNANIEAAAVPDKNEKEKYFPIFDPERRLSAKPLPLQTSSRRTIRTWQGGYGSSQMQIDAGQKQFGSIQCKQCGLLYTMHEPEEEKLHREFHASLHVLRFKGWIDEDIVAIYPEWGHDGRIIRLTNSSYPKRKERLLEILKIVDKELGFASYIMPTIFVAFLAVRKNQIVGLCLVQPLKEANKYLCQDGVDCCSLETYEAKCGISRIWVSPLHRRFHIATKLINAVQFNTIVGEDITLDKIAFSAPTEMGRKFAQRVTNMENFLVY